MQILGHEVHGEILPLIDEVRAAFPGKILRIAPYERAGQELRREVDPVNSALAEPGIDSYIAVWIKPDLPDEEFQAALAEELFHHLQAANGAGAVDYVEGMNGDPVAIKAFWHNLSSIAWDLEAHRKLDMLGLHAPVRPIVMARFRRAVEHAEENPVPHQQGMQKFGALPTYILWFWDLHVLGDDEVRTEFAGLQQRLWSISPPDVRELWETVAQKLIGESARDIHMVAAELGCYITICPKGTNGKVLLIDAGLDPWQLP